MMDREEIIEFGADEDALFLTEDIYDKAIIGVCDGRVCYDEDKVITILMEYNGLTYEDALEFYEFNIAGAYMGPLTPMFIRLIDREDSDGMYECFHCGEKAVGWIGDFTFEDHAIEGDGLIHELRCGNCGARIIYEIPDRVCCICGKAMSEGYCIGDGEEYYCSDECLHKQYTEEAYREMYRDNMAYWTEW